MKSLLIWIVTAIVFTAVGGLCVYAIVQSREHAEHPEADQATTASAPAGEEKMVSHDEAGHVVVTLDKEGQERLDIEIRPVQSAAHHPELIAFGTLQEDPAYSFTLRSPWPGIIHAAHGAPWPEIGSVLEDVTTIGVVEPRLGPVDRADLSTRLAGAHADVEQTKASLEAMRASLQRKRELNAQGKIVPDEVLQEAEAHVKGEEAKLRGTLETARVLESFMSTATRPSEAVPLTVQRGGRVAEVWVQPGEAVESGQQILRVAQFRRLLARVSLPAGESVGPEVSQARLVVPGRETKPVEAGRLPDAPTAADRLTGGQGLLFTLSNADLLLQPGMSVIARLQMPGAARQGVAIPRSAIVRVSGQGWTYVLTEEEQFTRRPVPLDAATPEGWFVGEGFKAGDKVVVRGAQAILSEELKFGVEEEEE